MPISMKPILDNLVLEDLPSNQSVGGIILPKGAQNKILQGRVVAAGPGYVNSDGNFAETQVKIGECVCYEPYKAKELRLDGKIYFIVRERDVNCVFES